MSSQSSAQKRARQVSPSSSSTALPPPLSTLPGSSILIGSHLGGSWTTENHAHGRIGDKLTNRCQSQVMLIDMLPDDVLLDTFDLCVDKASGGDENDCSFDSPSTKNDLESWQILVHVCRRWRNIVFRSPRRLNLRLVCTHKTPVRRTLDVWPTLPLLIKANVSSTSRVDKIIEALERSQRVEKIKLIVRDATWLFEKVFAAMQEPLPELTVLVFELHSHWRFGFGLTTVLPNSFLGGSAPRLERLHFKGIPFPGLPKLLLSATHLVNLKLCDIPNSGYISPKRMVAALSTLTSLERVQLQFKDHLRRPGRSRLPQTRSVLRVLGTFLFQGASEYLDDFMARIDAPQLSTLSITFFDQTEFDTPHLVQFIGRTPPLNAFKEVHFFFETAAAGILLTRNFSPLIVVKIQRDELDLQISSLEMVCASCLPPLSTIENLYIYEIYGDILLSPNWLDEAEDAMDTLWLELLNPFTAAKSLYLAEQIVPHFVPSLELLVGDSTTDVLPTLQNIFLEELQPSEPEQDYIGEFVAARQLSGHPITVSLWKRDLIMDWATNLDDWL